MKFWVFNVSLKQPPEVFYKKCFKNAAWGVQLFKKETPTQVFSCKFCEIFKSTFFTEHLWTIAFSQKLLMMFFHNIVETLLFFLKFVYIYIYICVCVGESWFSKTRQNWKWLKTGIINNPWGRGWYSKWWRIHDLVNLVFTELILKYISPALVFICTST